MLYDKEFLSKLDKQKNKAIYARVTALNFQEFPIEYIEGRVTQGSINLDGASAVRRSCSLTLVATDFNYNDYYWGLNTKFKLEIGVENTIDKTYPDIIWFQQGIYLISSFNTSRNTSSFSISIQGKDKMSLLNGEVGGTIESSVDFGVIEEEDKFGNWVTRKLSIQDIIKNIVHTYGGEPYHNIIINDLDMYGLELMEYRLDTPLFLYREVDKSNQYTNVILGGENVFCWTKSGTQREVSKLEPKDLELLVDGFVGTNSPTKFRFTSTADSSTKYYYFTKVEYGQTAGYRYTDLVYAGDLIANVGESVTSVLDKIKTMLTEFEYFYNLDGQFVFQKKQSFKETMWTANGESEQISLQEGIARTSSYAYEFFGGELITAFNNNPNLANLKNDYSVWGERDSVSGSKIPIHLRYSINIKPTKYTRIKVSSDNEELVAYKEKYNLNIKGQASQTYTTDDYDWREIIYKMAEDYYKYNFLSDFELRVADANKDIYPTGRTGYEKYYTDIQGFWRQLYDPGLEGELNEYQTKEASLISTVDNLKISVYGVESTIDDSKRIGGSENDLTVLNNYLQDGKLNGYNNEAELLKYYQDTYKFTADEKLITDLNLILGMLSEKYFKDKNNLATYEAELEIVSEKCDYLEEQYNENYYKDGEYIYWNKNVYEHPDQLNFWFDFLDTSGELQQFNVQQIGFRSKAINDTAIKSIYFRETPSVIFYSQNDKISSQIGGFKYISTGDIDINTLFTCSARGKNAKNKLDELIYEHGYCTESATITAIPIYYLEPNTRIYLYDKDTGLNGDYIASKITLPLTYNGTMSITATKAAENIL